MTGSRAASIAARSIDAYARDAFVTLACNLVRPSYQLVRHRLDNKVVCHTRIDGVVFLAFHCSPLSRLKINDDQSDNMGAARGGRRGGSRIPNQMVIFFQQVYVNSLSFMYRDLERLGVTHSVNLRTICSTSIRKVQTRSYLTLMILTNQK